MYILSHNRVRPTGRLFHTLMLVAFFSGLLNFQSLNAAETVAETNGANSQNRLGSKENAYPNPEFDPKDVVRIQLEALANNNDSYKDAGIEITFRFASPANKLATGPLTRFIRMLYNPLYLPMLNHKSVTYGEIVIKDDEAVQSVFITAADGRRVGYVFKLSKQKGGSLDQCWMTDSVLLMEGETI